MPDEPNFDNFRITTEGYRVYLMQDGVRLVAIDRTTIKSKAALVEFEFQGSKFDWWPVAGEVKLQQGGEVQTWRVARVLLHGTKPKEGADDQELLLSAFSAKRKPAKPIERRGRKVKESLPTAKGWEQDAKPAFSRVRALLISVITSATGTLVWAVVKWWWI